MKLYATGLLMSIGFLKTHCFDTDCFYATDNPSNPPPQLNNLNSDDVQSLADYVGTAPDVELDAVENHEWWNGGAAVCVFNKCLFSNTHAIASDVAGAVQEIHDQCCPAGGICWGGFARMYGDDGLELNVYVSSQDHACDFW